MVRLRWFSNLRWLCCARGKPCEKKDLTVAVSKSLGNGGSHQSCQEWRRCFYSHPHNLGVHHKRGASGTTERISMPACR